MNIQDIIVYGIVALAAILIAIRIIRSFTGTRNGDIRCADCPIYEQCTSVKDKKTTSSKECPQNKKTPRKRTCNCK